mgnify:CR=1 FL=1
MTRRVRLEPEAEAELYAAAARYEREVRGLGKDFVAATRAVRQRLRRWPNSGSFVDDVDPTLGVRRFPVARFPYQIVYVRVGDDVHVIAVAYDGRKPGYWRDRISK